MHVDATRSTSLGAIHATAVAIGGRALLIRGPSRAGKSRLALALIARATTALPIVLIGDDRILIQSDMGELFALPHPRIAGFVERRGLGLVAMPWIARAPLGGIVCLGLKDDEKFAERDLADLSGVPRLEIVGSTGDEESRALVLNWWAKQGATCASHPPQKAGGADQPCAKD